MIAVNNVCLFFFLSDLYLQAQPEKVPRYKLFPHGRLGLSLYPRKFDWRDHGAVGPVHDQKSVCVLSKQEVFISFVSAQS